MAYYIPSDEFTPEEQEAERARLDTLPTCLYCNALIDVLNGDEQFGNHHLKCFTEDVENLNPEGK